jgi:hypothetical protein
VLVADPLAALHELLAHHGDMRDRPAKRGEAEARKQQCQFAQPLSLAGGQSFICVGMCVGWHGSVPVFGWSSHE